MVIYQVRLWDVTELRRKKKLKVKPAVAEIELQRVNNVKSKGSLTAIKHFSTSFPFAPLVQQKCCVQTRVVLLHGECSPTPLVLNLGPS